MSRGRPTFTDSRSRDHGWLWRGAASLRCFIDFDHPNITITRAYQSTRNNWDFDPQRIEGGSNAGRMNGLDTCNPSFQRKLGDIDVVIDIALTLRNVSGKVIVILHLKRSPARLTYCTPQHFLVFLVICPVLQAKVEHGFAHLRSAQFASCEAISPNTPILKEKGSV